MRWWSESGRSPRQYELSLKQSTGIRSTKIPRSGSTTKIFFIYQPLKRNRSWRKLLHWVNSSSRTFFHSTAFSIKAIRLNVTSWMQRLGIWEAWNQLQLVIHPEKHEWTARFRFSMFGGVWNNYMIIWFSQGGASLGISQYSYSNEQSLVSSGKCICQFVGAALFRIWVKEMTSPWTHDWTSRRWFILPYQSNCMRFALSYYYLYLKEHVFPIDRGPFHEAKRINAVVFRVSQWIRSIKPTLWVFLHLEPNEGIWQIMQQCWMDNADEQLSNHQVTRDSRFISDRWGCKGYGNAAGQTLENVIWVRWGWHFEEVYI